MASVSWITYARVFVDSINTFTLCTWLYFTLVNIYLTISSGKARNTRTHVVIHSVRARGVVLTRR